MAPRANIFREVKYYREVVLSKLKDDVFSDNYEIEQYRLDAFDEILHFLKTLSWVSHEPTRNRVQCYLREGDLNARNTAIILGIENVNAVEQTVKYVSDKIRVLIDEPLSRLFQANSIELLESARSDFRKAIKQEHPYNYLMSGITRFLPQPKYDSKLRLEHCSTELSYLALFAHYAEFVLKYKCDQSKLAHLLSMLSSQKGIPIDREGLKLFLSGAFGISKKTGEHLSIKQQIEELFKWKTRQNPYNDEEG